MADLLQFVINVRKSHYHALIFALIYGGSSIKNTSEHSVFLL